MRVLIVDESRMVRERLVDLLADADGVEVVGHTGRASEAIRLFHELGPDALIVDVRLANGSGIDVLKMVKRLKPSVRVIVLTAYPSEEYRRVCLGYGADCLMRKPKELDRLPQVFVGWKIENRTDTGSSGKVPVR